MLRWLYFGAVTALLGAVSLPLASAPAPARLAGALLVGGVAGWFIRFVESQHRDTPSAIAGMIIAGLVVLIGWVGKVLMQPGRPFEPADPVAVLLAVGVAWLFDIWMSQAPPRTCSICKEPTGPSAFTCPRCRQTVCTKTSCWEGRHLRCKSCDDREVVVLPIDETWWQTRLGPRVRAGQCCHCYKEATEEDLRACGQCQWPQCRRCWDDLNGRCSHCDWVIPNLPRSLEDFVRPAGSAGQGVADARRSVH